MILCTDSHQGRTLYHSLKVLVSSGRTQPQIIPSFTLNLVIFFFFNTSSSPMNLKVFTAQKSNSLNSHPGVLRMTSTEFMQYISYQKSLQCKERKRTQKKSYSLISSKTAFVFFSQLRSWTLLNQYITCIDLYTNNNSVNRNKKITFPDSDF